MKSAQIKTRIYAKVYFDYNIIPGKTTSVLIWDKTDSKSSTSVTNAAEDIIDYICHNECINYYDNFYYKDSMGIWGQILPQRPHGVIFKCLDKNTIIDDTDMLNYINKLNGEEK